MATTTTGSTFLYLPHIFFPDGARYGYNHSHFDVNIIYTNLQFGIQLVGQYMLIGHTEA